MRPVGRQESEFCAVAGLVTEGASHAISKVVCHRWRRYRSARRYAYRRFQSELSDSRLRVSQGSALAATACGPIEYAQQGLGEPILVVHGAGGGFDQGLLFGRGLAQRGFLVTAMSRFGYLNTPLPRDASPQAQADAHASLLNALGVSKTVVVGVSAGAPSALQFALRHRQRCSGLVLLVPMTWVPSEAVRSVHRPARIAQQMLRWLVASDLIYWIGLRLARDMVIQTVLGTAPALVKFADAKERARIDEVLRSVLPLSNREEGLDNDARVAASLTRYDLENICVPTLIIALRDDLYGMFAGAQYTAEQIPGAKFVTYDQGGHLWVGHQDEVMEAVASFSHECRQASSSEACDASQRVPPERAEAGRLEHLRPSTANFVRASRPTPIPR